MFFYKKKVVLLTTGNARQYNIQIIVLKTMITHQSTKVCRHAHTVLPLQVYKVDKVSIQEQPLPKDQPGKSCWFRLSLLSSLIFDAMTVPIKGVKSGLLCNGPKCFKNSPEPQRIGQYNFFIIKLLVLQRGFVYIPASLRTRRIQRNNTPSIELASTYFLLPSSLPLGC